MKARACLFSAAFLAAVCQLVTCLSHGYILPSDALSDSMADDEDGGDYSNINVDEIGLSDNEKRAQLSLTGGLRSLADMVYAHGRRTGERNEHHNALLSLGKRNWRLPVYNFGRKLRASVLRPSNPSAISRRRSQQLSVSGPLSALANMLAAEGRRRKQSESLNNRMKLLELGKRSSEANPFDSTDIEKNRDYL